MKKTLILALTTLFIPLFAQANNYIPVPEAVNSRMFSTEGLKPLDTLERTYYTNQAIKQIEAKHHPQENEKPVKNLQEEQPKEKSKFKDLFKGFVIEY